MQKEWLNIFKGDGAADVILQLSGIMHAVALRENERKSTFFV